MGSCMEFRGARTTAGYGERRVDGEVRYAHRVAWEEAHGPIPDGLEVLHLCDNPPCINLDHLVLGTHAANMYDAASKGRMHNVAMDRTHCVHGHEFTTDNTYHPPKRPTHRHCRACNLARNRGGQ